MTRVKGALAAGLIVAPLLLAWGCAPVPLTTASPDELVEFISDLIIEPETTCAQLRHRYGVDYLPVVDPPAGAGLEFEETWLDAGDGAFVQVWYLPSQLDRGTIIYSNGSSGEMACYLFVPRLLVRNGWSVVMYNYRGVGLSIGKPSILTLEADLDRVLDWTLERTGRERVTLMGLSLGSIPSTAVAERRPEAVNGLILDSPLALGEAVSRFRLLFGPLTSMLAGKLDRRVLVEELITQIEAPLLIFAHGRDFLTPLRTVETIYFRAPDPKEMVVFEDMVHANGAFRNTYQYTFSLEQFLAGAWTPGAP